MRERVTYARAFQAATESRMRETLTNDSRMPERVMNERESHICESISSRHRVTNERDTQK